MIAIPIHDNNDYTGMGRVGGRRVHHCLLGENGQCETHMHTPTNLHVINPTVSVIRRLNTDVICHFQSHFCRCTQLNRYQMYQSSGLVSFYGYRADKSTKNFWSFSNHINGFQPFRPHQFPEFWCFYHVHTNVCGTFFFRFRGCLIAHAFFFKVLNLKTLHYGVQLPQFYIIYTMHCMLLYNILAVPAVWSIQNYYCTLELAKQINYIIIKCFH